MLKIYTTTVVVVESLSKTTTQKLVKILGVTREAVQYIPINP